MLLLVKIITATLIVVVLSVVAEKASPRVSGLLAGYPLGTALVLFFYGVELGPRFAADAAVFSLLGLVASQTFVYVYYQTSLRVHRYSPLVSSLCAIAGFLLVARLFSRLPATPSLSFGVTLASVGLFIFLFRKLPDVAIKRDIHLGPRILLLRSILAAGLIVVITTVAGLVGKSWAGLLSGFPMTLFPLILIIHMTYRPAHVHTIIKNFPKGLGALILYAISVYLLYPRFGIYIGTAAAFGAASLYSLAILQLLPSRA
jgi:hypothetical protein